MVVRPDPDFSTIGHRLDSILHQIGDHLFEACPADLDGRQFIIQFHMFGNLVGLEVRGLKYLYQIADYLVDIHRVGCNVLGVADVAQSQSNITNR